MTELYFTVTGTRHYHGQEFIEPNMQVKLVKEPDNEVDAEAIQVTMPGIGRIGYVANSPYTVLGESMSAGRLYDKIGETATGTALYVLPKGILCVLKKDDRETRERFGRPCKPRKRRFQGQKIFTLKQYG
ncbi:MAG: HIRAN domain-containing protein [Candidatus Heritagella sp.]